jgi:uncharacterized protein YecT (DUF1311 family)
MITLLVVILSLSLATAQRKGPKQSLKDPCAKALTQFEMNNCSCKQFQKANAELNHAYQKLLAANVADLVFTEKLKTAQRARIMFRDAQLAAVYPETNDPKVKYGSVFTMCYCAAQEELTTERTKQLNRMLKSKENDACGWDIH